MPTVNLDYEKLVSPAYYPMFTSADRYLAYKGSRGSGKSYATAIKVIIDTLQYDYVNWLVLRQFFGTQKDSTFATLKKVAYDLGVAEMFKFTVSPLEITRKDTGQRIFFRGMDDPLKITSIQTTHGNLCRIWAEECYELKDEPALDTVEESMRGILPAGGFYQSVFTFNPWSDKHFLKHRFFDEKTRKARTYSATTTYKDNSHLNADYVEDLEDMLKSNPNRARVAVLGEWGVAEGLVFEGLFEQRDFGMEEIANLPKVIGLDFGFKHDPTAAEFMAIDQKKRIVYVYDEIYQQGMLTQQIAQALAQHKAFGLPIIADSAEQRLITELQQVYGVPNIKPAGKGKDSIIQGIQFMQSYRFIIHPKAKGLWEEMNTYVYAKDKFGNWTNQPEDANNHAIDSLRYSMALYTFYKGNQYMNYQERVQAVKNIGL
ncbi:phage terminase large subunit [Ligilactobacillus salitolerans]|uniref:Phage terminase large subunit n=1 Tax=Ligilactobacillus salitolerans TaxID=1808352 RepID=A0A401IT03_9LACO|nr:PBSX family phage terminase large subunit [Ligilactobacillus salitolerans]GBG94637.1 phage terminase large subunit [Ligilactobacillus salitolerans]